MKQRKAEETRLIVLLVILIVGVAALLLYLNPLHNQLQTAAAGSSSSLSELPQIKVQGSVVSLLGQSSIMIVTKSGYRYLLDMKNATITNSNGRVLTYQNLKDGLKVDERPVVTITGYVAAVSDTPIMAVGQTIKFAKAVATPTPTPRPTATPRPTPTPTPTKAPTINFPSTIKPK